jgi:hypothetical protein
MLRFSPTILPGISMHLQRIKSTVSWAAGGTAGLPSSAKRERVHTAGRASSGTRSSACVFLFTLLAACSFDATAALADEDSNEAGFHFKQIDDKSLGLWEGDAPVLVYRFGEMNLPGVPMAGKRSSYVHPIYGLDGEVLTDDFPVDHYHHHGLFWGWPHVTVGGREFDLWKMRGIRFEIQRWLAKDASATGAKLGVENAWLVRDKEVMREEAWLEIHPADGDGRKIDIMLKWTPTDESITLGGAEGKSYGGLSLRFAPRKETVVTAPDGRVSEDLLITKLPWADLSGKFDAGKSKAAAGVSGPGYSGVALFVHPDHPDFPPEWMTRDYGVLCVGWPGVEAQTLAPGKTVTCRYRIWIHRDAPEAARIQAVYDAYAAPQGDPHE